MLLGRDLERQRIEAVLALARSGTSALLALSGEPGIGKTMLLEHAASRAAGMQVLRARGVESEAQVPFGSLLELVRPALGVLEQIPTPQAEALGAALALRPAAAGERFAVGAATLGLLAAYAEQAPVAILIDDAQWLDASSAQALLFAFRRLLADPIAVIVAVRADEPSLLDGADLPVLPVGGLSSAETAELVPGLSSAAADRLHSATAGNPLATLALADAGPDLALAPDGAPVLLPARIANAFLRQASTLDPVVREVLALCAASDTGELTVLQRAAGQLGLNLGALSAAETAGLVTIETGRIEFRHPLARSALYGQTPAAQRRAAHRALAGALPDRDIDRRAWHLAAAAIGPDDTAAAALEQAADSGRARSAYAAATAAYERAARLSSSDERRAVLLWQAAATGWLAGYTDKAADLLAEARPLTRRAETLVDIDELAGHIATRCGPVMRGYDILIATAERAAPERAVAMLAEAAFACLYAGQPARMLTAGIRAIEALPARSSPRARFLAGMTTGMAAILGGDAGAGASDVREAVALAQASPALLDDPQLLHWLAIGPLFLRQERAGRPLLAHALKSARDRAAIGALPFVLNLVARDQAATDQWATAGATHQEAIELARESGQQTELAFGLIGLGWLQARRGRERECRALVAEALSLSRELGLRLFEIWAEIALGELALGQGDAAQAAQHLERQLQLLTDSGITDADLSPAADLAEVYLRLGRDDEARSVAAGFRPTAEVKGQPWSQARALRCQGLVAPEADFAAHFDAALQLHHQTPDVFETARTQLAYGERLRRSRNRVLARTHLRPAAEAFERLGARPWADRARAEFAATGETLRRQEPGTAAELTPQELQIALLLTAGRTTRETASALFLSPKTVEYHLRHVYQKLGLHSRQELQQALSSDGSGGGNAEMS